MPSSFSALRTPFSAMFQKSDELLVTNANFSVLGAGAGLAAGGAAASSVFLLQPAPAAMKEASANDIHNDGRSRGRCARMVVLLG
jgi:hypothetical protein